MKSLSLFLLIILIIFLFYIFMGRIMYNVIFKEEIDKEGYVLNNFPLALAYGMLWPISILILILINLIKGTIYISDSITVRSIPFINNTIDKIRFYI